MRSLVVMGVSGCGKSRIGADVAERLGLPLIEGDEFHSPAHRALMREGIPLTDAHRADWLDRLGAELALRPGGAVLTCSALKASYRDRLRAAAPGLCFAWLDLDLASATARVAQRPGHYFPAALVATQFDALEPPLGEPGALRVDALLPPQTASDRIARWFTGEDGRAGPASDAPVTRR